jgi:hypothetical protein
MAKPDKFLDRMRSNSLDWHIDDLKTVARRADLDWRQPGTSHVTFSFPGLTPLTVPAHRPVKPYYVKRFIELIDAVRAKDDDRN